MLGNYYYKILKFFLGAKLARKIKKVTPAFIIMAILLNNSSVVAEHLPKDIVNIISEVRSTVTSMVASLIKAGSEAYDNINTSDIYHKSTGTMQVHYLDVGQSDCTLIICDGEAMLIDAGENDKGTAIQSYLQNAGIDKLKYVIGTHAHSDHIGGLDVIITKFQCENVFMPDFTADTATYRDVIAACKYKNLKITHPEPLSKYTLGNAEITILGPVKEYTDCNDTSICLMIRYGDNSFLFTGDATEKAEADMLTYAEKHDIKLDCNVYQAGHHGSYTSTSDSFFKAISPEYAVISCGDGNDYGHPHATILNTLRTSNVKTFRTDEQGTIIAISDGTSITWNMQPSETWQAGR